MGSAIAAFARTDARNVRREGLFGVVLAAPLLLALALRAGAAPAEAWVLATYGLDLAPYRPFVLAAVIVLHLPLVFGMVGALLVLDDLDDGALRAVRVTPLTLGRYLGYRTAAVGAASLAGLLVAVPLSGLVPASRLPWVLPALVLAAALGALVLLSALAIAGNKVEGLAVLKALGIPFMAPLAAWFVAGPWEWLLAPLPAYWPLRALWRGIEGRLDPLALAVGVPLVLLAALALGRRVQRRTAARS
jgi:fluoroquinolone transport system permease protein